MNQPLSAAPSRASPAPPRSLSPRKVSDRVVFMHAGRIHQTGPPQQILAEPKTAELRQFLSALDG